MNDLVTVGGKLALICVVAALSLGVVDAVTGPAIERVKQRQLEEALAFVSLGGTVGEPVAVDEKTVRTYYPLDTNSDGTRDGYVLGLVGIGYGGDMELLAAFSDTGEVLSVSMMDNSETPGLGKEAERPQYMEKFIGTGGKGEPPVPTSKQMLTQKQADAITGATITFLGVGDALEKGSEYVLNLGGGS